jgi:putative tryptophan/tyrosine transport system substrate-binding protein
MIGRREFISLIGDVATSPLTARAQQPALPVIGYLHSSTLDGFSDYLRALRQSIKESGYVEGENLVIEYRWAENEPHDPIRELRFNTFRAEILPR